MDVKFSAEIKDFKVIYNVLKNIIFKEFVVLKPMDEGLKITVEEMRSIETCVYIPKILFESYSVNSNDIVIKINHKIFLECLNIFGEDEKTSMKMSYKDYGSPLKLVLKHCDEDVIVDCDIKTLIIDNYNEVNLADECNLNKVVFGAQLFVEILSNIDHNSDELELFLSPNAPYFRIKTYGVSGETEIDIPKTPELVFVFNCKKESNFKYDFSNIRQIMKVLHYANKISISTGESGLLGFQLVIYTDEEKVIYVEYYITAQFMDD